MRRFLLAAIVVSWAASAVGEQQVVCEAPLVNSYRECRLGSFGEVRLVRELSESDCFEGLTWGTAGDGVVWVKRGCRGIFKLVEVPKPKPMLRVVHCASGEGTRTTCPADTKYGLAMVRRYGGKPCQHGTHWNFDEHGVWVADGCQADFAIGGFRLPPLAVPPTARRIVCESLDGEVRECFIDASRGVGLVRQLSKVDCVLNRNWGYGADSIWVSGGCRADFAVAQQPKEDRGR